MERRNDEARFGVERPGMGLPVCWILDRWTGERSRVFTDVREADGACEKLNRLWERECTSEVS